MAFSGALSVAAVSFSQNNEDAIIDKILRSIGEGGRFCCEFGAWDGVNLSNTRALILRGWSALLIEGNAERFQQLKRNYVTNASVFCERAFVDTGANSLANLLARSANADRRLDFLSIDIDGLDYDVFCTIPELRSPPRLIVVEVVPEHGPHRTELLPSEIAMKTNGQPLASFVAKASQLGYRLIAYHSSNAFFLAEDQGNYSKLPTISASDAWRSWFDDLSPADADFAYQRNIGLHGDYRFNNPMLTAKALGIPRTRALHLVRKRIARNFRLAFRSIVGR
jgi:hypothetical protein